MNAKNVSVLAPCEAPILLRRHGRAWDSVPIVLWNPGDLPENWTGAAQETFRTAQEIFREKILALLRIYPLITRKELASRLSLSDSGIKYHLEKMKAAGDIRRVGATKSGYWEGVK